MTEPARTPLALASEFPAATREHWLKLVEGVLKGADFDRRLVTKTYDGISIPPLSERRANASVHSRQAGAAPWLLSQRIDLPDPVAANTQALEDLMNGANALTLVFADASNANGFGLKDASRETLTRVLGQVHLDLGVTINLDVGRTSKDAGSVIAEIARKKGLNPGQVDIKFGYDPIGLLAMSETGIAEWHNVAPVLTSLVRKHLDAGYTGDFISPDGRRIHSAGGSEAQELAFMLSSAVAYLRALETAGLSLDQARDAIYFRLAVDADQFLSIAKIRSLRSLWSRVETACGLAPRPVYIAAETAWRMLTRNDAAVNILRSTVAVFAAGVGGADCVTALPHTSALGLPDSLSRRLVRNSQVVLMEEANLFRVADPAAGSGAIEALTDSLSAKAWALFQSIEAQGGITAPAALAAFITDVDAVRSARLKAISTRKDPLTGTSEYPNVFEAATTVLAPMPVASLAHRSTARLAPLRLAEPFEALRDATDAFRARTGANPKVFLANLGSVAEFTARTIFAKNVFEAGGIEAPTNDGFPSLEALVAAFRASGANAACICSTDAVYAAEAVAAARALKSAGAIVYLAGKPGDLEAALRQAGVTGFFFAGCNIIAELGEIHKRLGV